VSNLGGIDAIVHEQKLDVLDVTDEEGFVARGHHVARPLVRSESDRWHDHVALEPPAHSVVNTLGLSPAWGHTFESVALMPIKALGALLDNGNMLLRRDHLDCTDICCR